MTLDVGRQHLARRRLPARSPKYDRVELPGQCWRRARRRNCVTGLGLRGQRAGTRKGARAGRGGPTQAALRRPGGPPPSDADTPPWKPRRCRRRWPGTGVRPPSPCRAGSLRERVEMEEAAGVLPGDRVDLLVGAAGVVELLKRSRASGARWSPSAGSRIPRRASRARSGPGSAAPPGR